MTLIIAAVLAMQAHASLGSENSRQKMDRAEIAYYDSLSPKCGDNLLCYFTAAEVERALGLTPAQALIQGYLQPDATDRFGFEDGDVREVRVASNNRYYSGEGTSGLTRALEGSHEGQVIDDWGKHPVGMPRTGGRASRIRLSRRGDSARV